MSMKTQIWESDDSTDEARAAPAAAAAAADPAKKDRRDDNEEEEEEQGRSVRDAAKQTLSGRNKLLLRLAVASGVFAAICAGIGLALYFTDPSQPGLQNAVQVANTSSGPAISSNFADPCYLRVEEQGLYYAFATNKYKVNQRGQVHIQLAVSSDFATWNLTGRDALPAPGNWSSDAYVWSPDVVKLDNGSYVMYYTAQKNGSHCIGAATSSTPDGPYTAQAQPIVCPLKQGGALDPEGFRDVDGRRYLLYKIDGNSFDKPHKPFHSTPIMLQEVSAADGYTFIGTPVEVMDRVFADGLLVEGPALGRYQVPGTSESIYVLFFSSHLFNGPGYNIKYAIAANVKGPYTRAQAPLLKTGMGFNGELDGPGGIDVGVSELRVVFHSISTLAGKHSKLSRSMWTGTLVITAPPPS